MHFANPASRQLAGRSAARLNDDAIDDRIAIAAGVAGEPGSSARQIVDQFLRAVAELIQGEHDDVAGFARLQRAPVGETQQLGLLAGEGVNRVLEAEIAALADTAREQ